MVKTVSRFLANTICFCLITVAFPLGVIAAVGLLMEANIWLRGEPFMPGEMTTFALLAKALVASSLVFVGSLCFRWKLAGKNIRDVRFRLTKTPSEHSYLQTRISSDLIFLIVLALYLWLITQDNLVVKVPTVIAWIIVGVAGIHLSIAIHEAGHLAVAFLMNMELRKLQVGVGPVLLSHLFPNGLRCELRAWPQGGFMFAVPRTTVRFRVRYFLFVAAGPLADLIVLVTTYQAVVRLFGGLGAAFLHSPASLVITLLFWRTALSAISGLYPHKVRLMGRELESDGYLLYRLLSGSQFAFAYDWKSAMNILGADGTGVGITQPAPVAIADLPEFSEQRARLRSQLLRPPTSAPPA